MIATALALHILGACIWTGGHLLLSIRYLPKALLKRDVNIIKGFEKQFEPVGISALLIQVATGLWMAFSYYKVSFSDLSSPLTVTILIKLALLLVTMLLAIHARFFIIPKLTEKNLNSMALHITGVTLISVLFLIAGVAFRFGGISF